MALVSSFILYQTAPISNIPCPHILVCDILHTVHCFGASHTPTTQNLLCSIQHKASCSHLPLTVLSRLATLAVLASSPHSNSTTRTVMLSALIRSSHSYRAASSTRLQAM
jgi:hypothetical protein